MTWSQKNRPIAVKTSLGDDALILRKFSFRESLGGLFEARLIMASEDHKIKADDLLGQNVTIRLNRAGSEPRYFNAYLSEVEQTRAQSGGLAEYTAVAHPWPFLLGLSSNCRAWQDLSVTDVVSKVLRERGFGSLSEKWTGKHGPHEYLVQYRESDLHFVLRLLEREGLYWFTTHKNGEHTVVIADSPSGHETAAEAPTLRYLPETSAKSAVNAIQSWTSRARVLPGGAALVDFDFENPTKSLLSGAKKPGKHQFGDFERFDDLGGYKTTAAGDALTRIRLEELRAKAQEYFGETTCRSVEVGSKFTLENHPRPDQNAEYLVTELVIEADASAFDGASGKGTFAYRCGIGAIPAATTFRPARVHSKPVVAGPQPAIIVGGAGQEICTDKHGRVRVQFFWDRYSKGDDTSSCWLRVAQAWAGRQWGAFFLPRVGQEVLVDFLHGDPDRPVVTGSMYNGDNTPPYPLPSKQTVSTIKSLSTPGGGGFNELRFEDKKGSEQIFIHAERDLHRRIKKDTKTWIGGESHEIVQKDSFREVKGDLHDLVKGDRNDKVDLNASLKVGMNLDQKVGMNYALQSGMQMHLKAGMSLVIEAGMMITLKAGGGFITVGPTGVAISGTPVLINSGGAAGSGSGASPTPPKLAQAADKADAGQTNKPPKPPRPPKPTKYGPAAMVLRQAAKNGTPFCEKCAQ